MRFPFKKTTAVAVTAGAILAARGCGDDDGDAPKPVANSAVELMGSSNTNRGWRRLGKGQGVERDDGDEAMKVTWFDGNNTRVQIEGAYIKGKLTVGHREDPGTCDIKAEPGAGAEKATLATDPAVWKPKGDKQDTLFMVKPGTTEVVLGATSKNNIAVHSQDITVTTRAIAKQTNQPDSIEANVGIQFSFPIADPETGAVHKLTTQEVECSRQPMSLEKWEEQAKKWGLSAEKAKPQALPAPGETPTRDGETVVVAGSRTAQRIRAAVATSGREQLVTTSLDLSATGAGLSDPVGMPPRWFESPEAVAGEKRDAFEVTGDRDLATLGVASSFDKPQPLSIGIA